MFYAAEAMLRSRGQSFSSHRAVISGFAQHFVKPGSLPKECHRWLQTAFEKRQVSDYEFLSTLDEPEVLEMTSQAQELLSLAEKILKNEGLLGP
jgi:uncharacterized protein (UPF0332 family)